MAHPPIKLQEFGGMLPAWDDRFLPDGQASYARNTYLYSGALNGWREPSLLRSLTNSAAKYAFRVPNVVQSIATAYLLLLQQPLAGDQVTLGEVTYTFRATPISAYDVLLGASVFASQQNLYQAMVFGQQDTAVAGAGTAPNPAIAANNPYLGYPFSNTSASATPGAGNLLLMLVQPSGTQELNSIDFLPASTNGTAQFVAAVYNNISQIEVGTTSYENQPGTLVASTGVVTGCSSGQACSCPFSEPVTLIGGEYYWIGILFSASVPLALASNSTNSALVNVGNVGEGGPVIQPLAAGPGSGPPQPAPNQDTSFPALPNPIIGITATVNPVTYGGPTYQLWGNMTTIQSTDPENNLGTQNFSGTSIPYIEIQAPDYGAAYNNTNVSDSTGRARLAWNYDLVATSDSTAYLAGGSNPVADTGILGASTWLEFLDADTNVLRSPVVDDSFSRVYFASPSQFPQYNTALRVQNGQPPWLLGVPAPPLPPSLTISGGGTTEQVGLGQSTSIAAAGSPGGYEVPFPTLAQQQALDSNIYFILQPAVAPGALSINDIGVQVTAYVETIDPFVGPATQAAGVPVFQGAIYADNNGAPGAMLALGFPSNANITEQVTSGTISSATTIPGAIISFFSNPVQLAANTKYWIGGFFVEGTTIQLGDDSANAGTLYGISGNVGTPLVGDTAFPYIPANMMPLAYDLQMWGDCINTAQLESRAYVYTWVTLYGEEGPPSPPAINDGYDNATWTVAMFAPLPEDVGTLRNIVQTNLYRTVTATGGETTYFLVASFDVGLLLYADSIPDNTVAENFTLASATWYPPPGDLQGIVNMPNGMMAGWKGNEVWFCEPYRPHAWPGGYVLTTEYPIVGLGVVGQTLVACTESAPYVMQGVNPGSMVSLKIPFPQPCISRGGIVSTETGVFYPSQNGLVKVTQQQTAENITEAWITREKWDSLTPSENIRAQKMVSAYFAYGSTNGSDLSVAQEGFTIELSETADRESFTIYPQPGRHRIGFSELTAPNAVNIDNLMVDPWTGVIMTIQGGQIWYFDFSNPAPLTQPYLWRSKKFQLPHRDNLAAFRVWFDIPSGGPQTPPTAITVAAPSYSTTVNIPLASGMFGVVRILADGKYVCERELRSSTQLMRVPSGYKASTWQVEVEARVIVTNIKVASSVKMLATIE